MEPMGSDMEAAIRDELVYLWGDFAMALRSARCQLDPHNEGGGWSIEMVGIADRIGALSKVVGPAAWEAVPVDVLLDGWWEAVHARAGIPAPAFDREVAADLR